MIYVTIDVSSFNVSITLLRYRMIITLAKQCSCVNLYQYLTCMTNVV